MFGHSSEVIEDCEVQIGKERWMCVENDFAPNALTPIVMLLLSSYSFQRPKRLPRRR